MLKTEKEYRQCPGCKVTFTPVYAYPGLQARQASPGKQDGPMWRYGTNSSECWAVYTQLLAYEGEHFGYPDVHRFIVDAYMVQHPQNFELQKELNISQRFVDASVQWVAMHLLALYMAIEKKMELKKIAKSMAQILKQGAKFEPLDPPQSVGEITVANIAPEYTVDEYDKVAWQWAQSVWNAWALHHDTVRAWYEKYI